jgi:ribonuclease inhibitor
MPPTFTGWRAMNIYTFDFDEIDSQEDFYREFARVFGIEKGKVTNLDSLWDIVTTNQLPLPFSSLRNSCRDTRSAAAYLCQG